MPNRKIADLSFYQMETCIISGIYKEETQILFQNFQNLKRLLVILITNQTLKHL